MLPPPDKQRPAYLQLMAVSWSFGWPIVTGVAAGYWLDQTLGTSPGLTLFLGLGSMAAAIYRLIVLSRREVAERRSLERERGD